MIEKPVAMKLTRPELMEKLKSIREGAIANGMKLLSAEEILDEVANRRGGTATMQRELDKLNEQEGF
jgi:hypothetical protein